MPAAAAALYLLGRGQRRSKLSTCAGSVVLADPMPSHYTCREGAFAIFSTRRTTMASETGTAGNDTLDHFGDTGPGTLIGLAGDDCIFTGSGPWTVTGDSGQDTIALRTGNTGSIVGGTENDSIWSGINQVGALTVF